MRTTPKEHPEEYPEDCHEEHTEEHPEEYTEDCHEEHPEDYPKEHHEEQIREALTAAGIYDYRQHKSAPASSSGLADADLCGMGQLKKKHIIKKPGDRHDEGHLVLISN